MPGAWAAAAIGIAGLGMQGAAMANAPGAPGQVVGKRRAALTSQEREANALNLAAFNVNNNFQNQFDNFATMGMNAQDRQNQANRRDLKALDSQGMYQAAANRGVSQAMAQMYPQLQQSMMGSAARSGGPGSGAFFAANQAGTAALGSGLSQANLQGRMGNLGEYLNRWQQNFKNEGDLYQQRKAWLDQQGQGLQTSLGLYNQLAQNAAQRAQGQVDYQTQLEMARQGAQYQGAQANSQALSAGGGLAMSAANTGLQAYGAYQNGQAAQQAKVDALF